MPSSLTSFILQNRDAQRSTSNSKSRSKVFTSVKNQGWLILLCLFAYVLEAFPGAQMSSQHGVVPSPLCSVTILLTVWLHQFYSSLHSCRPLAGGTKELLKPRLLIVGTFQIVEFTSSQGKDRNYSLFSYFKNFFKH